MKARHLAVPYNPEFRRMGVNPGWISSAGISVSFMCRGCKTGRPVKGRKPRMVGGRRDGWYCAACVEKGVKK